MLLKSWAMPPGETCHGLDPLRFGEACLELPELRDIGRDHHRRANGATHGDGDDPGQVGLVVRSAVLEFVGSSVLEDLLERALVARTMHAGHELENALPDERPCVPAPRAG